MRDVLRVLCVVLVSVPQIILVWLMFRDREKKGD